VKSLLLTVYLEKFDRMGLPDRKGPVSMTLREWPEDRKKSRSVG